MLQILLWLDDLFLIFSLSRGTIELPRSNMSVMIIVFLSYQTLKYVLKYQLWQSIHFFLFFDQFLLNTLWWSSVKYINFCCYIHLGNQSLFHYVNADNFVWNEQISSLYVQCLLCYTSPFPLLAHNTNKEKANIDQSEHFQKKASLDTPWCWISVCQHNVEIYQYCLSLLVVNIYYITNKKNIYTVMVLNTVA